MTRLSSKLTWRATVAGLTSVVAFAVIATAQPSAAHTVDRTQSYNTLVADYGTFLKSHGERLKAAKSNSERSKMHADRRNKIGVFHIKATELYQQNPRDQVAFDSIIFSLATMHTPLSKEMCVNLRKYHLRNPRLYLALSRHYGRGVTSHECEVLFNLASRVNDPRVSDIAKVQLADLYQQKSNFLANLEEVRMPLELYVTSEARSHNKKFPSHILDDIRKEHAKDRWLRRPWRPLKKLARELAQSVEGSETVKTYFHYGAEGFEEQDGGSVADAAKTILYTIEHAMPGAQVIDFGAKDLDGQPVSFDDHAGKVVLLDLWATWCEPCVAKMPKMRKLKTRMKGRPFELITLSLDKQVKDVKVFMQGNSMPFTNWYIGEDEEFFKKWPVWPIPKVFVIDETGVIRSIPRLGYEDLSKYVDRLVASAERRI